MVILETFCLWPTVFLWVVMLCFMAKPSALVIFVVCVPGRISMEDTSGIAS